MSERRHGALEMFDVAGLGVSAIDLVYVLPAYPAPEGPLSKLPIHSHFVSPGGQTATAMAGCAALGLRVAYLGATGSDAHGALVREELTRRGVDISHAIVLDGPQPYSIVLLAEGRGERVVLWRREPGRRDPVRFSRFRLLHVDDIDIEAAIAAANGAREAGRLVTTDIDQVTGRTKELIQAATHPILAEHVPGALTGETNLARALRLLRPLNAGPIVVTRGASGAVALDGEQLIDVPGFEVDAVDTTGAGDVFRAGFIATLLDGTPLKDMLRFANAAAAISCTRRGAMTSVPTRAEVDSFVLRLPS